MLKQFELIDYDVWGNQKDGYNVNQAFHTHQYYNIDTELDDKLLVKQLKSQKLIKKGIHFKSIEIDGDDMVIYFSYKGKPEFELRLI